jgi:hypothetical protein
MAIEVFNRYEKKFLMDAETFSWLSEKLKEHMRPDKFNAGGKLYNIANIYYDTPNDELIRASIEGPVYKEKLRLRSYGVPELEDEVFLEIKKKYKGMVNKRRTRLKLREAYDFVDKGIKPEDAPYINKQVLAEIEYFLKTYSLVPKVYLTYDRMAFFDKEDDDFRVTFDTNIRTRRIEVGLEKGNYGELLIGNELWLMEVKSSKAIPLWFVKLLEEKEIKPVSFSKYGTEYKKQLLESYNKNQNTKIKIKGDLLCLNQYLPLQQKVQEYQPKGQLSA